jgi:hypothetical protein
MVTGQVIRTTYGFMAGIIGLFLSSLCVIKVVSFIVLPFLVQCRLCLQRQETERFKKIDGKRGGGGFV